MDVISKNFNINRILNERGQSLVSVLTAIPVVVITSTLIGTVVYATYQESSRFKARSEINQVQQELRLILDSKDECAAHLDDSARTYDAAAAQSVQGMDVAFKLNDGSSVIRSNQVLVRYGVFVNSLKYRAYSSGGGNFLEDPRIPGNQLQYGEMILNSQVMTAANAPVMRVRDVSLGSVVISVAPDGNISRCFLIDQAYDLCAAAGGEPDPIVRCRFKNRCAMGMFYAGDDASGNAKCITPEQALTSSCPAGMVLTSNGAGDATCQWPYPTPTPTPLLTPTPVPTLTPTPGPTVTPTPSATPTVTPTVTPSVSPTVTPTVTPDPSVTPPPPPTPTPSSTPVPTPTPDPYAGEPMYAYTFSQLGGASSTMSAQCRSFLGITSPVDLTSDQDIYASGGVGNYYLDKGRSVSVGSMTGGAQIDSAVLVNIQGNTGASQARAQYGSNVISNTNDVSLFILRDIQSITGNTGDLCIGAQNITTINGSTGNHHIIAMNIGLISGNTGTMHIYGATVNKARGNTGDICLHNGARVLDYDASNTGRLRTDCL